MDKESVIRELQSQSEYWQKRCEELAEKQKECEMNLRQTNILIKIMLDKE